MSRPNEVDWSARGVLLAILAHAVLSEAGVARRPPAKAQALGGARAWNVACGDAATMNAAVVSGRPNANFAGSGKTGAAGGLEVDTR
jgi:hypothetical protein